MNAIEIKNITKNFGPVCALDHVSMTFEGNKIYGLLGRNGAGKSTLLNVITNRIYPADGTIKINGQPNLDNDTALGQIYLMSEKTYYPETMKIQDAFKWSKNFYPAFDMDYALELSKKFKLNIKKKVKTLSTGYGSIFKLIIALSVNTPFVFFDEPVLGLDANHRELFYQLLLQKYIEHPFTAIISTHLIEEVSNIVEDVIIIKEGKIIANTSREELLSQGYTVSGRAEAVNAYIQGKNVIGSDRLGGLLTAYILDKPNTASLPDDLEITGLDLQKLFIQMTNS